MNTEPDVCVAVCRRVNRIAFAVVGNDNVYEVGVRRRQRYNQQQLTSFAVRLADAYGTKTIVAEPGVLDAQSADTKIVHRTIDHAKQVLCGSDGSAHHELVAAILKRQPKLARIVRGVSLTGANANQARWRTLPVLAIALGMAFLHS